MTKKTVINEIIANLNGYLQSMRRLGSNQCHYSASVREINKYFENEIEDYKKNFDNEYQIISQKHVCYKQIEQLHHNLIYSKLTISDKKIIKLFEWDIIEYFGLASTSLDVENAFNPIVRNGAIVLKLEAEKFNSLVYYFVEVDDFMVTVILSEERKESV